MIRNTFIHIPGIGPKTLKLMRRELGIENLDQLQAAIAAEKLRELPGLLLFWFCWAGLQVRSHALESQKKPQTGRVSAGIIPKRSLPGKVRILVWWFRFRRPHLMNASVPARVPGVDPAFLEGKHPNCAG